MQLASSPNSPRGAVFSHNFMLITVLVVRFTHTRRGGQNHCFVQMKQYAAVASYSRTIIFPKGTKFSGCKVILATLLLSWERVCGLKFQASFGERSHQAHRSNYWESQDSSPREAQKDLINAHQYLRRGTREDRIRLSSAVPSNWTRSNGYKLELRKLHLYAMKHFFSVRVVQHWHRLPITLWSLHPWTYGPGQLSLLWEEGLD